VKDWLPTIGGVLAVLVICGFVGLLVWYDWRYPCIQYRPKWVPQWTEIRTIHHDCGKGCSFVTIIPIDHPAHWEQECLARGDRHKGDVEAASAPIPAERNW
jgi:hypothetical protein